MERGRTWQEVVEPVILDIMSDGYERDTADIQAALKRRLPPTAADNARANRRSNESKYDQIISNALEAGRNISKGGLLVRVAEGRFAITDKGVAAARQAREEVARMIATLDEQFSVEDWT